MKTKMTHPMRMELAKQSGIAMRPQRTRTNAGSLEELIAATGYHKKSAIRVLNGSSQPKRACFSKSRTPISVSRGQFWSAPPD
ncbi:hypothetical protein RFN25_31380 [Mesorhizobium abyssinicae]|uniref:hypothetical protein n=1 Tax=Mesorhizobium abyssinicae TaxID=1209958 RepID=UPI002A23D28D|nr:hypothetical protein [Mesorhizobium abyssinicae]MDX8437891.1 hypothetical protein [Mesorhizobium abyssinicae]